MWGAISANGTLELICAEENITAQVYADMLEHDFFAKWKDDLLEGYIWMQDNASPHAAAFTKAYLENKEIRVLNWLPHSPDSMSSSSFGPRAQMQVISNQKKLLLICEDHQVPCLLTPIYM